MKSFLNKTKKHILNLPGKSLDRKLVVFESDDWGSERTPSREALSYLNSTGLDIYSNPFNYLDSLESVDDLSALFEVLIKFSDQKGNHPVITANSVTANPNFKEIKLSGFNNYRYETSSETYNRKKLCEKSFSLIKEGMSSGLYHPQFHGREHLNIRQWLSALQSGDEILLKAFDRGIYSIDIESAQTKRKNFTAAFDGYLIDDLAEFSNIVQDGTKLFKAIYGFSSKSFIAPCYIWHPSLNKILKNNGIDYLQGLPVQLSPRNGDDYRRIYHFQGQRNKFGQKYFIRNAFFEPSLNPEFNYIKDVIKRLEIIFHRNKPAIIGTHRVNFIGSLDEKNRSNNLEQFSLLLKTMLDLWPDLEFTTTDKLGDLY